MTDISTLPIGPSVDSKPQVSRAGLGMLLAGVLVSALAGLHTLLYPLHVDQAMFAYMADRWLRGGLPYVSAWDVKPPGIYIVYGAAQLLFGRGMAACRIADFLAVLMTAGLLGLIARRLAGDRAGFFAPAIYGIVYFTCWDFHDTAQAESFAAPFAALLCAAALHAPGRARWPLAAGLGLGALLVLKSVYLPIAALPLAAWLRTVAPAGQKVRAIAILSFGALAIPAAVGAYFAAHNALGALIEVFRMQKLYGTPPKNFTLAIHILASTRNVFLERPPFLAAGAACLGLPLIRPKIPGLRVIEAWALLAAATVIVQWRCYEYHYIVLAAPFALGAAILLAQFVKRAARPGRYRIAALAVPLVLLTAPVIWRMGDIGFAVARASGRLTPDQYWAVFNRPGWYPVEMSVQSARYIATHSAPTDHILVYDFDPLIYYLSRRDPSSRQLSTAPIFVVWNIPFAVRRAWLEEQIRQCAADPPLYLVVGNAPWIMGLNALNEPVPRELGFARDRFRLEAVYSRDRIYRRLPRQAGSLPPIYWPPAAPNLPGIPHG